MRLICAQCGQPIKAMRGAPGFFQHASRTTAACDLDSDHVPGPDWDALGTVTCRACGEPVTGGAHHAMHVDSALDTDHDADPVIEGAW